MYRTLTRTLTSHCVPSRTQKKIYYSVSSKRLLCFYFTYKQYLIAPAFLAHQMGFVSVFCLPWKNVWAHFANCTSCREYNALCSIELKKVCDILWYSRAGTQHPQHSREIILCSIQRTFILKTKMTVLRYAH